MKSWLRRIRGALGLGMIWGIATGAVGALVGGVTGLFAGQAIYLTIIGGGAAGILGLSLGSGFGALLSLMERNRTLEELSAKRAGALGFVAGAAVPLLGILVQIAVAGPGVPMAVLLPAALAGAAGYGIITGVLASGTVALAKRAPDELGPGAGPGTIPSLPDESGS